MVLDCGHVSTSDFTAAKGFKAMISDFRKREQPIIFYNTSPSVVDTFLGVNIEEFVVVNSNEELLSHLRSEFYFTVFHSVEISGFFCLSDSQILREIKFGECISPKTADFCNLVNFIFCWFFSDLFEPHEEVEAGNAGQNGTDYVINTNNGVQA